MMGQTGLVRCEAVTTGLVRCEADVADWAG